MNEEIMWSMKQKLYGITDKIQSKEKERKKAHFFVIVTTQLAAFSLHVASQACHTL